MKYQDLDAFQRAFQDEVPTLCLIVGKETEEAAEWVLKRWNGVVKTLDSDSFTSERFIQEVETLPFLTAKTYLHVKSLERLSGRDIEVLTTYAKQPNRWVSLLLSAAQLSPQSKLAKAVEEKGVVLRLPEKKYWEKERHCAEWLTKKATQEGVGFPLPAAHSLVKTLGIDRTQLKQELLKLICYVGERKKITEQDIRELSCKMPHETLFQLTDALFQNQAARAVEMGRHLEEEGMAFFPLLAGLRTQMHTGVTILTAYQNGGASAVTEQFPYLKGGLLDKKLRELQTYGLSRLKRALILLFDAELEAKNSQIDPTLFLEILLIKLTTHATLSPP